MIARKLNMGKKESGALVVLLLVLFSIPLLLSVVFETDPVTSIWPPYYVGGSMLAHGLGSQLYDVAQQTSLWNSLQTHSKEILPYIAPPYVAILLEPFGALPYAASVWLWVILNLTLLLFILYQLNQELIHRTPLSPFWIDLGVILFLPTLTVIVVQQTSLILVLAILMSWICFKNGREYAAGAWLSLLFIKPHLIGVPILLLMYKKKIRALAPILFVAGILTLVSFVLLGSAGLKSYFELLSSHSGWDYNPDIRWATMTTSWAGFVQLLLVSKTTNLPLVAEIVWAVGVGFSIYLLLNAWRGPWITSSVKFDLKWALLVSTAVFTTLHGYAYELVLLVPPFTLVFAELVDDKNGACRWLVSTIRYSLFIVPACILIAFFIGLEFLPLFLGAGNFLLAFKLIQKGERMEVVTR